MGGSLPSASRFAALTGSEAVGVALLGTLFFEVVSRQGASVPVELFGPAYEVVLGAVALLMGLAWLAARTLPETAPEEVSEVV